MLQHTMITKSDGISNERTNKSFISQVFFLVKFCRFCLFRGFLQRIRSISVIISKLAKYNRINGMYILLIHGSFTYKLMEAR